MTKVLLAPSSFSATDDSPRNRLNENGYELINNPYKRKLTKPELLELLPGVKGIIAGLEPLDREVLERSELTVISRVGSGLSNVDINAAAELGIEVRSTPTAPVTAVAELTIGCLLSLLRRIHEMNVSLHQKTWNKIIGRQLAGMVVAVIGLGNIGTKVAQLLTALDAKVIGVDPAYAGGLNDIPVYPINKALEEADVVTLHCSGEGKLIGKDELNLMKDGIYILNAARGTLIDEVALCASLEQGKIAGAWLDTFKDEPYTGNLASYDQVILTPHIGSYTRECRRSMELEAVDNLIAVLSQK